MANVRIGSDGSIIKNDEIMESTEKTIIREDGTIENTNIGTPSFPQNRTTTLNTPPNSPLINNRRESSLGDTQIVEPSDVLSDVSSTQNNITLRRIKEKEYDIQILDGRIKNAVSIKMILSTIILSLLALMGIRLLLIPALLTFTFVVVGYVKRSDLKKERARLYDELQILNRGMHR